MAEAAFSEDGKYYSLITQDGRLRIWDTETNVLKQEYTPDLHLTSPPSCLQWISVNSNTSPTKGVRRKSFSGNETQCIALGTASGKILIYSVSQAQIETVLTDKGNAIHSRVQSLDWHRKYGLFSCTSDSHVWEWDLESSCVRNKYNIHVYSKNKQGNKISAIRIVPHNQKTAAKFLISSSWQIRLWRLNDSEATLVKCLGHNAAPRALLTIATVNNSSWLIEGSQTERLLSFWDVTITEENLPQENSEESTPCKKQRKKSLTSSTVPVPTYNFVLEDAPRIIDVELKVENGATRLSLAAATRSGVVHYYGHLLNGASPKPVKPSVTIQVTTEDAQPLPLQCVQLPKTGDLLIGYCSGPAIVFEKVIPDLKTKTQVLIRGDKSKEDKNEVVAKENDQITYVEPMGGVSRKRGSVGGKVEVTMESRLSNLSLDVKSRSKTAVNQNLTKLLIQGLHSRDKNLILTVLQRNDPAVAHNTISCLPVDYIPALLEQLTDMATRKTSQCSSVCTWLCSVLQCHSASLLATSPHHSEHLTRLLAIFTQRRSNLCQLLSLKGRLDLTSCRRLAPEGDSHTLLQYEDSSSDEELPPEGYESDSRQSWEDGDTD
ncbi:unnamed protein product [Danaus chrysippus]|uniref:(African queen) hypothetical protein n=1 Tax=Danaus chrysippus TaxID=151541 RepID=A0A8J2QVI6_9NEOP|nr:unnamed protein product [Danaus chrysippus]